jgi:hypothetical protein
MLEFFLVKKKKINKFLISLMNIIECNKLKQLFLRKADIYCQNIKIKNFEIVIVS